jgi:hypothetical protein
LSRIQSVASVAWTHPAGSQAASPACRIDWEEPLPLVAPCVLVTQSLATVRGQLVVTGDQPIAWRQDAGKVVADATAGVLVLPDRAVSILSDPRPPSVLAHARASGDGGALHLVFGTLNPGRERIPSLDRIRCSRLSTEISPGPRLGQSSDSPNSTGTRSTFHSCYPPKQFARGTVDKGYVVPIK